MRIPLVRLGNVATVTQGMGMGGRAAGAREGDWEVRVASIGDIQDDRLRLDELETRRIERNMKTEKHLLQPDDVLVSARSSGLVEDVARFVGCVESLAVGLGPLVPRKMLKRSHCFYPPFLRFLLARISLRASRCLNRYWLYARLARRLDEPA